MIRKYAVLIGLTISLVFLGIAISIYPGGTYQDHTAIGFSWTKNYFSNLFETKALNGAANSARLWAYFGMFFYAISCALFFVNMSKKIPEKNSAYIIQYAGIGSMLLTFLIVTPLHNLMLTASNILFWTCISWITAFLLKTRLHFIQAYSIFCLLIFFYAIFIHASGNWDWLPIIQKVNTISSIFLILGLEYFTQKEDFALSKR